MRTCAYLLVVAHVLAPLSRAQDLCGASKDLVVRALERIAPANTPGDLEDALQLLKHASEQCPELGDAWYYRSLFERKLGRATQADYALRKAKFVGSEALDQGADPFTPSTQPVPGERFSPAVREKWAVVIGISRFRDRRLKFLPYTTKDAQDFAEVLTDGRYGRFKADHVHVLTDENATTVRIKTELNWLARTAAPEDLAVIYLSTHGSKREKDIAGVNYVLTHDTDVSSADTLYATAYPMVEVADIVRTRMKARKAAVFLDICHSEGAMAASGAAGLAAAASSATLDRIRQGVGRVIMSSSRVDEVSWESDRLKNGFFTYYLIEALKQGGGGTPLTKLYDYVRSQVSAQVMAERKVSQVPVLSASDYGAEVVLGVLSSAGLTPRATSAGALSLRAAPSRSRRAGESPSPAPAGRS
jgi:hypothetical protein